MVATLPRRTDYCAPVTASQRVAWDDALPCNVIGSPSEDGAGVVAVATYTCPSGSSTRHAVYLLDARHPVANAPYHPAPQVRPFAGRS